MWLCTQHGFYSIVQKQKGEFHIRARLKRDLENLQRLGGFSWKIHRTAPADYRWRVVIDQADVIAILVNLGEAIDYSNFKSRIHELPDQEEKSSAYGTLWSNLYQLQR
jgi:hypothetical protein